MVPPNPDDVHAQLERLYRRHFRGVKLRRILGFLVEEWLVDGGSKLTLSYIGKCLNDELLTFEEDSDRWGYPKTRANLAHVRKRLRRYYETEGYRDRVIIKLNPGSYAPVIAYNPVSTAIPDLDPAVARLILRAKTALDLRTLRGAWRALHYYGQIPLNLGNSRQVANSVFIPMAAASIIPSCVTAIRALVDVAIAHVKQSGVAPWECIFAEACAYACYEHQWQKSLDLFEVAITASQGEATYFWWYTALLASQGRGEQAMEILDGAVRHFSRTNIATRTDLALLQVMAGRFDDAEENLSASLDFTSADNPLIACNLAYLYEAQDRLNDAASAIMKLFSSGGQLGLDGLSVDEALERRDWHIFLNGMFALVVGRTGAADVASEMLNILLTCKVKRPAASSVEIALAQIGVGHLDSAVEWLTRAAFEENDPFAMWFHIFPPLRHLHGHEAFRELLKSLNLPVHRGR